MCHQAHLGSSVRKNKCGYWPKGERVNRSRLSSHGTERDRYKCAKKRGQETRKGLMRQANDVIISWLLEITEALDHCSLSRARNKTDCPDHTMQVKPSLHSEGWGRWDAWDKYRGCGSNIQILLCLKLPQVQWHRLLPDLFLTYV